MNLRRFFTRITAWALALAMLSGPSLLSAYAFSDQGDYLALNPYDMELTLGLDEAVKFSDIDTGGPIQSKNGHFVRSNTGERIRFWGVNLVLQGNFPTSAEANEMAATFRDYGFNIVRLHNIDSWNPYSSVFSSPAQNTTQLDESQLRKLDYLVAALKKQGIYVDLNLHVSRAFRSADGVKNADSLPYQSKFVTIFDDTMISLQKQFATALLTRKNTVTGIRYADDPAIALVEITNENMIYEAWMQGYTDTGKNDYTFPQYYLDELDSKWGQFLIEKYGSYAQAQNAWYPKSVNLLQNGSFDTLQLDSWYTEVKNLAKLSTVMDSSIYGNSSSSGAGLKLNFSQPQFSSVSNLAGVAQGGFSLVHGESYTVSFKIKANAPVTGYVYINDGHTNLGMNESYTINAGSSWKEISFSFSPYYSHDGAILHFSFDGNAENSVWLDDIVFERVAAAGSASTSRPKRIAYADRFSCPSTAAADMYEFYYWLESAYNKQMLSHIRGLGFQGSLSADNHYSAPAGILAQSQGDFTNAHGYTDHITFPSGSAWSTSNYSYTNVSALEQEAAVENEWNAMLPRLALSAVEGKPFVVSEWNVCFPNDYEYELPYLMAAYASLQDWDALMVFSYSHGSDTKDQGIQYWFDLKAHPGKLAMIAMAGLAFRRGDISSTDPAVVSYANSDIFNAAQSNLYERSFFLADGKIASNMVFYSTVRKAFGKSATSTAAQFHARLGVSNGQMLGWSKTVSKTGQLSLSSSLFTAGSPRFVAAVGKLSGKAVTAGNATFHLNSRASASIISLDGNPLASSSRLYMTVVGRTVNEGQDNSTRTWGKDRNGDGVVAVQMEKVTGTVELTVDSGASYKVYAVNEKGGRTNVSATLSGKTLSITLPGAAGSYLYEIVRTPTGAAELPQVDDVHSAISGLEEIGWNTYNPSGVSLTVDSADADFIIFRGDSLLLAASYQSGETTSISVSSDRIQQLASEGRTLRLLTDNGIFVDMPAASKLQAYAQAFSYSFEECQFTLSVHSSFQADAVDRKIENDYNYVMRISEPVNIELSLTAASGETVDLSPYPQFHIGFSSKIKENSPSYIALYAPEQEYFRILLGSDCETETMGGLDYRTYAHNTSTVACCVVQV